ncbi:hypothetical protein [Saccharibacillus sacchari]|uniref:Uncharacterized protein n=1 Tax=Saccharibacillus sacchari TaxID=456493 RepID=A0ACC6P9E2_9BACL
MEKKDLIDSTDSESADNPEADENPEAIYLLAAHAAYAGEIAVARLLFNFLEGDEYCGACPNCETDWYVWPQEGEGTTGELVVYTEDPVSAKKEGHAVCPECGVQVAVWEALTS